MTDIFDIRSPAAWTYEATASTALSGTALSRSASGLGVQYAKGPVVKPKHDAQWWAQRTAGFDFSDADRVPPAKFNRVLWSGLMNKPYPAALSHSAAAAKTDNDD
jgi:hypothetical protein